MTLLPIRRIASLLLSACACALAAPAPVAAATASGGLPTCRPGRELHAVKRRVRKIVKDAGGHRRRKWVRRTTWVCRPDRTAPALVTGLVAVAGDGRVTVTWAPSSDAGGVAGYEVYRDGQYVVTITDTTFTDPSLVNGVAHQYSVRAVDIARNLSPPSGVVWALPKALPDRQPPGTPLGVTATPDKATLTVALRWTAPADDKGVTSYRVYRDGALAGTATTPAFTDTDLNHKSEYRYTVAALDAAGNVSPLSQVVSTYVS